MTRGRTRSASSDRRDADRHVDEEEPAPGDQVGQHATEQQAEGGAAGGDRAPDAQRPGALGGVLEGGDDDRQRGRGDERAAEALEPTAENQHRRGLGEAVEQRGGREQRHADDEQAPAAEQVGRAAAEQQEATEDQRVGVDDPLQVRRAEKCKPRWIEGSATFTIVCVEHDHELGEAGDHEDHPAVRTFGDSVLIAGS